MLGMFLSAWAFFLTPTLAYEETDLLLIKDYLSYRDTATQHYSIIICQKSDALKAGKVISEKLRRFVSFQEANGSLKVPVNEMTTFVLNVWCPTWMKILQDAVRLGLFRKPFQWLLLGFNTTGDVTTTEGNVTEGYPWSFIAELPLLVDSDFDMILKNEEDKFTIVSAYKISEGGNLIKEYLAEWSPNTRLKIINSESIAMRRWNLQGLVVPATLVITDPDSLNHMEDLVNTHKDTTSKVTYNFIRSLEFILNLSLSYKIDDVWGIPLENGSWTGMVGDLQRGDVVLGASPLFFAPERLGLIEYYAMVSPTKTRFIFISPPLSHSSNMFALPFADMVWFCCLATFVVSCVLLFVAINAEEYREPPETNKNEGYNKYGKRCSFSDVIVYSIGAICQQGTVAKTYKPAGRIITFFTYITYMFLYISYSASIVAILQSSDTSIQTLMDLYQSPMKAGADDVAYSQYYFKTAEDDIRKMFYHGKIHPNAKEPPNFFPPEDGIKKVRQGLFAYHVETSVGYQIIQKTFSEEEKCGLQELTVSFLPQESPWLVMKKHNPYSELIKIGANKAVEAGFKTRYVRRYYTMKPKCGSKTSRFLTVGIIDCHAAFLFLFYGIIISIIVFIVETIIKRYFNRAHLARHGLMSMRNWVFEDRLRRSTEINDSRRQWARKGLKGNSGHRIRAFVELLAIWCP